jgi:hypothetical protein
LILRLSSSSVRISGTVKIKQGNNLVIQNMHNNGWTDFRENEHYRDQRMREAENERLAKALHEGEDRRFYRTLLAGVGSRMVAWGVELQLRYGNIHVGDSRDLRRVRLSLQERAQ